MKVISDGMKDRDIRFTCGCCSCVFEANENDDGFFVTKEDKHTDRIIVTDDSYFKQTGCVEYDEFSVTETKAICQCPNCGSVSFGENTRRGYIGRTKYRVI